jgi:hypothetical protein
MQKCKLHPTGRISIFGFRNLSNILNKQIQFFLQTEKCQLSTNCFKLSSSSGTKNYFSILFKKNYFKEYVSTRYLLDLSIAVSTFQSWEGDKIW